MPPKKKTTMSMSEFAAMVETEAPSTKTSWADEDFELPTAPMGPPPGESFGRSGYQQQEHRIGRGTRDQAPPPPPVIDYNRIPTSAPFNTFVGNLPFEISEADLRSFFAELKVREIKVPLDQEQKTRGFAYVEFSDQDSMIKALMMSGQQIKGRYCRIDIAEARQGGGFEQKSFANDWRTDVAHTVADRSGRPNFDRPARAPQAPEVVFDRSQMTPVHAEPRSSFNSKGFDRSQMAPVASATRPTSDWRSMARPVAPERSTSASSELSFKGQAESKKPALNLLPRTKPLPSAVPESAEVYATKGKFNPFGNAKPIEKNI